MEIATLPFDELLSFVVDNRGRTCPTASNGLPLIATNCISNEHLYPTKENVRYIDQETYDNWFRAHPRPGDVIFVLKGAPGRCALVPDPVDFCIAQDMVAVRADREKIDPQYLFAALRSPMIQESIDRMHVGTMIPHFKKGDFNKLIIPLPDRPIQEFIGSVHMALVERIELNRRMNETLEAMARAIFKDWFFDFGPTRAKMEGRAPYLAPDIWSLFPDRLDEEEKPEGWNNGALSNIADLNPETWTRSTYPNAVEYVDLSNTKWGTIEVVTRFEKAVAPSRAQRILRPGDTIVGTVRPGNGSYAFVSAKGLTGSTGFAVLRPKKNIFRELVYLAATSRDNIDRLSHQADGGAYPAVRPEIVAATEIMVAPDSIFVAFNDASAAFFERIEANKSENQTLAATRDLLLPRLMSGEIRAKDAETLIEEVA
ncbi:restriction endonuclease subunit S [Xanthobacter aminoxidans]|uniref:restriction endonuclease subunit S n=1 Tax=Xanthobacter aminoxidans TaxID=186280 RepID=UPI003728646D